MDGFRFYRWLTEESGPRPPRPRRPKDDCPDCTTTACPRHSYSLLASVAGARPLTRDERLDRTFYEVTR